MSWYKGAWTNRAMQNGSKQQCKPWVSHLWGPWFALMLRLLTPQYTRSAWSSRMPRSNERNSSYVEGSTPSRLRGGAVGEPPSDGGILVLIFNPRIHIPYKYCFWISLKQEMHSGFCPYHSLERVFLPLRKIYLVVPYKTVTVHSYPAEPSGQPVHPSSG